MSGYDEECYSCGGPAHPDFTDGLYDLCPMCGEEWDEYRSLTPEEEEELFKDSPISLEEWMYIIVHGLEE